MLLQKEEVHNSQFYIRVSFSYIFNGITTPDGLFHTKIWFICKFLITIRIIFSTPVWNLFFNRTFSFDYDKYLFALLYGIKNS